MTFETKYIDTSFQVANRTEIFPAKKIEWKFVAQYWLKAKNTIQLSFTNICILHSNFVDCESFLESNSPDILALCETNLDDSIDSGNFSVRGYLPLIRKDSGTHMHGLTVYVKEGLPFA